MLWLNSVCLWCWSRTHDSWVTHTQTDTAHSYFIILRSDFFQCILSLTASCMCVYVECIAKNATRDLRIPFAATLTSRGVTSSSSFLLCLSVRLSVVDLALLCLLLCLPFTSVCMNASYIKTRDHKTSQGFFRASSSPYYSTSTTFLAPD